MADSLKRRPPRDWDDDDDRDDDRPARRKETGRGGGAVGTGVVLLVGLLVVLIGGIAVIGAVAYFLFAGKSTPNRATPPQVAFAPAAPAPVVQPMAWNNGPENRPLPRFEPPVMGGFPDDAGGVAPAPGGRVRDGGNAPPFAQNPSTVVEAHRAKLRVTASKSWSGQWVPAAAVDRSDLTSWFPLPEPGGGAAWIALEFPQAVTVKRVTALGNREPQWTGYVNRKVRVELFDAGGKVLSTTDVVCVGAKGDADAVLPAPVGGVRIVRVALLETDHGGGAVAEFQVD